MRVGLDGTPLLTPKTGIGKYTFELASALNRLSSPPELVSFSGWQWNKHLNARGDGDIIGSHQTLRSTVSRLIPESPKKWIKNKIFRVGFSKHQLDLFHATNYVASPFEGTLVVTVHDLSFMRYPETLPRDRLAWLSKGLPDTLRRAKQIIADSHFTKNELISLLDIQKDRISVVHLGVGREYKPRDNEKLHLKLKEFDLKPNGYILSVGTIEPRKNILSLIQAYELLPDSLKSRWPLVLVGMRGWKEKTIFKRLASSASKGKIRTLGYISPEKLPYIYNGATLFVYPSIYEGFGLPPLEAMASGVSVITSDRASLPEIVGDAGVLVDPDDVESFAMAIESLLDDKEKCKQLVQLGLLRSRNFTWKACAENTFNVYQDALRQD